MSAVPPSYDRQASFTSFQTPDAPTTGADLEAEFNRIKASSDATQARLAEIQRDDGLLKNLSVHPDALSAAVRALLTITGGQIEGAWATGVSYDKGDVVEAPNGATYIAAVAHLANASFDVDLAAGRWLVVSGVGSATTFVQEGDDAVTRSTQDKARESVSVKDFGAVGDGASDDTDAIQAAIDYAAGITGAMVYLPRGVYRTTNTITLSAVGASLVGDGCARITSAQETAGSAGVVGVAARTGATRIYADFTSGPVVRVKSQGQSVEKLTIDASPTRKAAALSTNYGLHIESDDASGAATKGIFISLVKVINQPSHGIVWVNDMVCSRMEMADVSHCAGHGFVVAGGSFTGRTFRARPGQMQIDNCRAMRTGGHALLIGAGEVDSDDIPYRCEVNNFEAFYNLITPAIAMDPANLCNAYISGENHNIDACAFDGRTEFPTVSDTHSAMYLQGRVIYVRNFRAITSAPYAIYVGDHPIPVSGFGTQCVHIDGILVSNSLRGAGYFNPAVFVDPGCVDVKVWAGRIASQIATLSSKNNTAYDEYYNGIRRTNTTTTFASMSATQGTITRVIADRVDADVVRAQDEFTLADDAAGYFSFSLPARGIIHISGNTSTGKAAIAHFRCGDGSAHVTLLAAPSGVVGQTGTLSGTTGVDGNLTIAADTVTNRLYIENRTGGSRSYTVLFAPVNGATQSVSAFT